MTNFRTLSLLAEHPPLVGLLALSTLTTIGLGAANYWQATQIDELLADRKAAVETMKQATAALNNTGGIIENLENALGACIVDHANRLPAPLAWPPAMREEKL